jgi:hypothetical protein
MTQSQVRQAVVQTVSSVKGVPKDQITDDYVVKTPISEIAYSLAAAGYPCQLHGNITIRRVIEKIFHES